MDQNTIKDVLLYTAVGLVTISWAAVATSSVIDTIGNTKARSAAMKQHDVWAKKAEEAFSGANEQ